MSDMVLFTRTVDFLAWLLPALNTFPRSQRFAVTKRLQDAALDFQETIIEANNARWTRCGYTCAWPNVGNG